MNKKLAVVLALILIISLAACGSSSGSKGPQETGGSDASSEDLGNKIRLMGSTPGSISCVIMEGFAALLNEAAPGQFNAAAETSSGGLDILRLLDKGDCELGIAQAGLALSAFSGTYNEGSQPKLTNLASVTYLYPSIVQVMASNESGIKDFSEVSGKIFCAGSSGSAVESNTKDLCRACGIDYSDTMKSATESQAFKSMKEKEADGANFFGTIGSAAVAGLYAAGDYHLISFTEEQLDAICSVNSAYYRYTIPAGTYKNQDEEIRTVAVSNYLYVRNDFSEEMVYDLIKTLYENSDKVTAIHDVLENNFNLDNCLIGLTIPLHSGAEKYYKEVGALH